MLIRMAFVSSSPVSVTKPYRTTLVHGDTVTSGLGSVLPRRAKLKMSATPKPPTPKLDPSAHSTLQLSGKGDELSDLEIETKVVHGGVHRDEWTTDPLQRSVVNPPVYHASTVIFPTMSTFRQAASNWPYTGLWYGRHGNPTTYALEEAFAAIEGGDNACLTSSGVAAVNAAILAFVNAGDHVLITDAVYEPTRTFCDRFLGRFGVTTTYFSPTASPDAIAALMRSNTRAILVESPASLSFEIMDVAAIAERAHAVGVKVIIDNTWGPTLFAPFEHGCDVSVNAATKYICGHSDLMMGIIAAKNLEIYRAVKNSVVELGCPPGPDDAYLALRGLRTLSVRIQQHGINGLRIAHWLEQRDEVIRVMHPGLESHPQHELFKQQFKGSTGLFGFQLKEGYSQRAVDTMVDGMRLFPIGLSWGGYESLISQCNINAARSIDTWKYGDGYGQTLRLHIGLENVDDLIKDLEDGFERLRSANNQT